MPILFAALAFVLTGAGVIVYMVRRNARLADELQVLETKKAGVTMLAHAMEYLTKEGIGANLEWTSARSILEVAMYNVLYN